MLIAIVQNWVICQVYCSQTIKLSVRSIAEVATDQERTGSYCFFTDPIPFHYKMQTRTRSEFGFAPQILWGQNQHYISQRPFFRLVSTWISAEKMPQFSVKTFIFFGLYLNFGRQNAFIFGKDLFFTFWYLTELGRKNALVFSEDLFFVLTCIWAEKTPQSWVRTFFAFLWSIFGFCCYEQSVVVSWRIWIESGS